MNHAGGVPGRSGTSAAASVLVLGILASLHPRIAAAEREPPPRGGLGPIPAGDDWHCYTVVKDGARHSGCHRSQKACRHMGAHLAATFGLARPTCRAQAVAAVFTFFSVKNQRTEYQAYASMRECEDGRRRPQPAGAQVASACEEVEATEGTPFAPAVVPAGRRWWCATTATGGVATAWCKRARTDCLAQVTELTGGGGTVLAACRRVRAAFATTWSEAGVARSLVAPTLADCEEFTEYTPGTSRCTRVR